MGEARTKRRAGGGRAARIAARAAPPAHKPVVPGMTGGQFRPLSDSDIRLDRDAMAPGDGRW